ncbi:ABC-2 family transporter protein [Planctomycetes bacterium Pan216]|uniref:ABC-2 family transporter protein n=1 Tax=Kolteria novifilia TaxID=2527975 RepID=A0A518AYN8_9BACT|nr:ABC-2 family transporter protein [Planctomycetes bacterium Pan216]
MLWGPIFAREALTTPRRPRYATLRTGYAALLFVLMWTAWQAIIGFQQVQRIGDLAYFNVVLFQLLAFTQLAILLFLACIAGVSSISYEKARRTFILLLITRLPDHEIIVDKFFCCLLQVGSFLVAGVPIFMLMVLFGGISFTQVFEVQAATLGAILLTSSLAVLMATWREQTFQAFALTGLVLALWVLVIELIAVGLGGLTILGQPFVNWCTIISPFRAVAAATDLGETSVAFRQSIRPGLIFLVLTTLTSVGLLVWTTYRLRAWNPRGEPIMQREETSEAEKKGLAHPFAKDKVRKVWRNPVLWREIITRAYGGRPVVVKVAYVAIFLLLLAALLFAPAPESRGHLLLARSLLPLAVLSLLLVNAQAVTAITTERDLRSIDLLLVTDVSPKEFVFGKLLGIIYNAKEMVIGPLILIAVGAMRGFVEPMAVSYMLIDALVLVLFATVLGVHFGLRYENTRIAIANSLGTMFLLFVGILVCLFLILVSGRFEAQWASFILFIVLGSIGFWISLSATAPSNAIALTAAMTPFATFYCIVAVLLGDQTGPFLVGLGVYGFAIAAMLVPMLAEFDVATGRTTAAEG